MAGSGGVNFYKLAASSKLWQKKGAFHLSHITSTFFAVTAVLMNFKSSFFPSPLKS